LGEVEFFNSSTLPNGDQKIEARQDVQEIPARFSVFGEDRAIVQRVAVALRSVFPIVWMHGCV